LRELLLKQRIHPRIVMELLGHSQVSLSMEAYSHVMPDTLREAVAGVEALLGKSATAD
jgi:integrase